MVYVSRILPVHMCDTFFELVYVVSVGYNQSSVSR